MVSVCFVCLGNICRSPTADGIMCALVERAGLSSVIEVDSAGTGSWHVGERADRRSRTAAKARGYDLSSRARQFKRADFARFDYILAMDRSNHEALLELASDEASRDKVRLFRSFDPEAQGAADVPDPYYGGSRGFEDVLDMCERACKRLLEHICQEHGLTPRGAR